MNIAAVKTLFLLITIFLGTFYLLISVACTRKGRFSKRAKRTIIEMKELAMTMIISWYLTWVGLVTYYRLDKTDLVIVCLLVGCVLRGIQLAYLVRKRNNRSSVRRSGIETESR